MNELELRLQDLGGEIAYPSTPRFDLDFERRPARAGWLRPLALGFAILVVALAGVLALSPGARSAFLEIFQIRGATVERVETLPDVQAQRIDFGERVGREEAERRAGFELLDLGDEPDAIFVRPDGLASVVYGDPDEPRLVLSQARGAIYDGFIKKTGGRGTLIERGHGRRRARSLRRRARALRHVPGRERVHLRRGDLSRRHRPALEPRRPAAAAGGRPDARRRRSSWPSRSSRDPVGAERCIRGVTRSGGPDEEAPARARRRRGRRSRPRAPAAGPPSASARCRLPAWSRTRTGRSTSPCSSTARRRSPA